MAMPIKDFRQLEKLMMMTTSDNDSEALSALRMANKLLVKHNYNWSSAFQRLVHVEPDHPEFDVAPEPEDEDALLKGKIRLAFDILDGVNLTKDFGDFIESLRNQFLQRGRLTDAQRSALFRAADRHTKR